MYHGAGNPLFLQTYIYTDTPISTNNTVQLTYTKTTLVGAKYYFEVYENDWAYDVAVLGNGTSVAWEGLAYQLDLLDAINAGNPTFPAQTPVSSATKLAHSSLNKLFRSSGGKAILGA